MEEPGSHNELSWNEKADIYFSQVKAAFTANLSDGMNKLATEMANADPSCKSPTPG